MQAAAMAPPSATSSLPSSDSSLNGTSQDGGIWTIRQLPPRVRVDSSTEQQSDGRRQVCREAQERTLKEFGMPASFTLREQYWAATGFLEVEKLPSDGQQLEGYTTALRFLIKKANTVAAQPPYYWVQFGFWTKWHQGQLGLLWSIEIDSKPPIPPVLDQLIGTFREEACKAGARMCTSSPFGWHPFILQFISQEFDASVWGWRHLVREKEEIRAKIIENTRPDYYEGMHETARHAIHSSESLAMALEVVDSILSELKGASGESWTRDRACNVAISRAIHCQKTLLQCSHKRSQALEERIRNEINLAFDLRARHDSAVAAQDSATMRTISFLGFLFLPGTFISAIFSMSFFNCSDGAGDSWNVSSKFWVYWVTALPITALTAIFWFGRQHLDLLPRIVKRVLSSAARDAKGAINGGTNSKQSV